MAFSPEKDSVNKVITVDSVGSFIVNHNIFRTSPATQFFLYLL